MLNLWTSIYGYTNVEILKIIRLFTMLYSVNAAEQYYKT